MDCFIGREEQGKEPVLPEDDIYRGLDGSLWYLGQSTLLREYIGDDLCLLFHHLVRSVHSYLARAPAEFRYCTGTALSGQFSRASGKILDL